ncbi:MAG: leucine-rich repeat protein [Mycoplasma sp.]
MNTTDSSFFIRLPFIMKNWFSFENTKLLGFSEQYKASDEYKNWNGILEIPLLNNDNEYVLEIADHAFYNDINIKQINFHPETHIKTIGESCFVSCQNNYGALIIPKSVEEINSHAFYENNIKSLSFEEGSYLREIHSKAFSTLRNVHGDLILSNSIEKIGPSAFAITYFDGELFIPDNFLPEKNKPFRDNNTFSSASLWGNASIWSKYWERGLSLHIKSVTYFR